MHKISVNPSISPEGEVYEVRRIKGQLLKIDTQPCEATNVYAAH